MFKFLARRSLVATVVVSISVLALAAPPAVAATQSQPFFSCQLFAFQPTVSADHHEITGFGASTCWGNGWQDQKLVVTLLAQPLPTLYQVLAQASTGYSSSWVLRQRVSWACTFTGTRTYTLETSWYGRNGDAYSYKFPPRSIKLTCAA
ncbi:MAG TPA: hypothetical protein VFB06_35060 [Streptosporangiaceae bacterium]|nr:hypothetical protein [Streptosporangiaceae bacterium]